jgi:preprotein translocase subunit SecD
MKVSKTRIGLTSAALLLAALPHFARAAGDIEISKVNPGGKAKTRVMQIQSVGRSIPVVVDQTPILSTADVREAAAVTEKTKVTSGTHPETRDVPALRVRFTPEGARKLAAVNKEWQGKQIALIVDGKLVAAPRMTSGPVNNELIFSGSFTADESRAMAASINGHGRPPAAPQPEKKEQKR